MNMFPTLIGLKVGKILEIYLFVTHILFLKKQKSCKTEKNERSKKESKLN